MMILYSFVLLVNFFGFTLPAPQRGLPSDMQAQSQVKSFLDTYTGAVGTNASGNLPASVGFSSSVSWARPRPPPPPTTNDRPQHRTFHPSRGPPHRGDRERRRLMGGTHVAIDTTLVSPLTRMRRATTQTCRMICRGSVAGR